MMSACAYLDKKTSKKINLNECLGDKMSMSMCISRNVGKAMSEM